MLIFLILFTLVAIGAIVTAVVTISQNSQRNRLQTQQFLQQGQMPMLTQVPMQTPAPWPEQNPTSQQLPYAPSYYTCPRCANPLTGAVCQRCGYAAPLPGGNPAVGGE